MNIQFHNYRHPEDYARVDEFLIRCYLPGNRDGNWVEPAWEYMHFHPSLEASALDKIGVWEDEGEVVAVATYESRLGEAFFQFNPAYRYLRREMLDYAEANLCAVSPKDTSRTLRAYVNDDDAPFQSLVEARGYRKEADDARPLYRCDLSAPLAPIRLPPGYRLTSLADDCDWAKVHRVLWRGFDHPGEPPITDQDLEMRRRMFDTPRAQRSLKIAISAPYGGFVAFCGMFYEPTGKYAYVEPVATDPDYRRMGLGRAVVLEGMHRCAALGAATAYIASDQVFYQALGFRKARLSECWVKVWDGEPA